MKKSEMKYGISLSGGGARGLAHIGVLRALEEKGIFPAHIAGTSMGAIVGAFYAAGRKPREILEILKSDSIIKHLQWGLPSGGGMISLEKMEKKLEEQLGVSTFEDLEKPLHIAVTNLTRGKPEVFDSGPLIRPIVASASLPIVFKPVEIDGDVYVDGGLLDNLPLGPLPDVCDKLIGSHVNHISVQKGIDSIREVADRSYKLAIFQSVKMNLDKFDIFFDPPDLMKFKLYDFGDIDEIYEMGYREAMKFLS